MGFYVHLSVVMSCDKNEPVADIAKKYIGTIENCNEADWYLKDLSERTGHNDGPKGGLSLWGIVGNYTSADNFVESLEKFWIELFKTEAGPFDFEHIIVFSEMEQSEMAQAHEISYDEKKNKINVKVHNLPFAWMQM